MSSLNPLLDETRFCPRCGAPRPEVDFPRRLACAECGFLAYFNPKPVAAVLPREPDGRFWLLRRGFDPSAGLWTFPGGFVELGETVEEAGRRETSEEIGVDVELGGLVGVFSRPDERVVLIVFSGRLLGTPTTTAEATEVRLFTAEEIPWGELAFWSTERALRDSLPPG